MQTIQILDISSTSSPALETASANATTKQIGPGQLIAPIFVSVTRAGGAAMTGATFRCQISRDGTNWVTVPTALASTGTVATAHNVTASQGTTAYDALLSENWRGVPFVRVTAQAITNDAVAGDSAAAYISLSEGA